MVAILEKSEYNVDFHPIVDFVEASPLRIETTKEGTKILATIDGNLRTVSEASIRQNLKLNDEAGISSLPDAELFENLTLIGYNVSPNQKFTFQKGQFFHQWKYLIHTIMQCISPKSTGFNEFSSNIDTALVCMATNRVYNFSKMIFDGMGEGSGTPIEPHHTPSTEAQQTSPTTYSSPTLPPVTTANISPVITTAPLPTIVPTDTPHLRHYTRRARIAQSLALPPVADEPASPLRDVRKNQVVEDKDRGVAEHSGDDSPIKGRRLDVGEKAAERVSDDTEEMATVLTSMDATTVLSSGVAEVPTGSGSIPTAAELPTGSDVVLTDGPIFATATVVTPYTRRKGKETMVESETLKKRDAEIARIHAEEELQIMIDGLDRSNETVAKYLQEYHQFATELPIERRIQLISDLVRYQDNYAKTSTLPHESTSRVTSLAADEGRVEDQQFEGKNQVVEDKDRGVAEHSGDDSPIKGRRLDVGEKAAERASLRKVIGHATSHLDRKTKSAWETCASDDDGKLLKYVDPSVNSNMLGIKCSKSFPLLVMVIPLVVRFLTASYEVPTANVIEFGDSYKAPQQESATASASEGSPKKMGRTAAFTTEDMQKRRNNVKARTTLLLALPDEHQLRFSKCKTTQDLVILKLIQRVKRLERELKVKTPPIKIQKADVRGRSSPSFSGRTVPLFDSMLVTMGEGLRTPTEPHHTPTPEALQSPQHDLSSSIHPPVTTETIPTVIPTDTPPLRQYTRRAKIAQSLTLPTVADKPASPLRDDSQAQDLEITSLKARIQLLEDKDGGGTKPSGEDAPIKGRSLETEEEAGVERSTERGSDDTEELVNVLTSLDAASILTSEVQVVSVPSAAEVATATVSVLTGNGLVPIASLIFTTASLVTPYTIRKGKEKIVETDTPKKKKLQEQIDIQLAREMEEQMAREYQRMSEKNEVIARHLHDYEQASADLRIREKIELINELVKYQDHHSKILKYQAQQSKPLSKKQHRKFYISVLKSYAGWKTKHFKEEGERVKRKGLRLEQESTKKVKTSKELSEEDFKGMMQLVLVEEVYVEALQLWTLMKETLSIRQATSDKEKELWVELKRLFEPDVEDQLWTHTQALMYDPVEWRLYDSCVVHYVLSRDQEIFMLVERDCPLRKGLGRIVRNKMFKAFPLPDYFPTASEDRFPLLSERDVTAEEVRTFDEDSGSRSNLLGTTSNNVIQALIPLVVPKEWIYYLEIQGLLRYECAGLAKDVLFGCATFMFGLFILIGVLSDLSKQFWVCVFLLPVMKIPLLEYFATASEEVFPRLS
nr:synaptobrevin, longin-like domain protein [Tanacetum cinerariifolium]